MSETTLPGREACPGHLTWSAFGAYYPDTVCATALEWNPGTDPGAVLCDADDDFRPKDVPCPFCAPDRFIDYQWAVSLGEHVILWGDRRDRRAPRHRHPLPRRPGAVVDGHAPGSWRRACPVPIDPRPMGGLRCLT